MACLAPNKLADGTEVACRECKLCQLKRKNDWVGRNIAESKTSKFCYVITATYGRGKVGEVLHERAVILTYSDCQKFLKLLRRHGYEVRFFITGEYGSEKQRAHWNIIVYSDKPLPQFAGWDQYGRWTKQARYKQRFNWVRCDSKGDPVYLQNGQPAWWWPHGFVHIDEVNVPSVRYVCKYVLKDLDANGKQGHKGQSKDPPLGTAYFRQLAEKYVEQGLAPQSPEYRFPEAKTREGEPIRYWLKGRVLELFLQHYIEAWAAKRPGDPRPPSQFVDLYEKYGKVVNDEAAMLLRQEFPRGESRQPIPTGQQIKRGADDALYERAVKDFSRVVEEVRQHDNEWLEGLDEQERQRLERRFEQQRKQRWTEFNHRHGRHHFEGFGWVKPEQVADHASGSRSCSCCPVEAGRPDIHRPDEFGRLDDGVQRQPEQRGGAWGQFGERPLGPVGRYNRDYSDPGKAGPGQETGPRSGDSGPGGQQTG
ncbi:replication initiation protein [Tortoise microvirus 74]|nr:replication initiation protein [Tortoise microvirus 74]